MVWRMDKNTPKYLELISWIRQQIDEKKLLPGQKLYSENELSEMFHLSRQTVRHAIGMLENENILNRIQGSGTYINSSRLENLANRNRIAVVTTYVDSYIFPRTIHGIENILSQEGLSVQIAFTNNLVAKERSILQDILERDEVAGIISETTKSGLPNPNLHFYQEIMKKDIPVLFINSYYQGLNAPHVSMNDKQAGKLAANQLIGKGHKKIGGIFKLDDGQGHLRYQGYLEALEEAGLTYEDLNVIWIDTEDEKHLKNCGQRLLERLKGITGVVTYNDEVAFSLMEILKEAGVRVPNDISIASIDDSDLAVLGDVKLTSVQYPMENLGEKAAKNLVEMINNPKFDGTYEFDLSVVKRESVFDLNKEE